MTKNMLKLKATIVKHTKKLSNIFYFHVKEKVVSFHYNSVILRVKRVDGNYFNLLLLHMIISEGSSLTKKKKRKKKIKIIT